jgi:ubiquinone/menaquinone biosynthesis C-methylase UbiE
MKINTKFLDPEQVLFRTGLSRAATVVDLGAGSGFFALASAKIVGEQGKVFVVDILESALAHVSASSRIHNYRNVQTIRKDLEKASVDQVSAGTADLVIIANLLHGVTSMQTIFTESYRMLKTGGKLLVIDWNEKASPFGPKSAERKSEEEIKTVASKTNLKFQTNIETDSYHYGLIFNK